MTTRIEPEIATLPDGGFPRSAALARRRGLRFVHVAWTGSTNDDLADEARAGNSEPAVLVADHQTAGRGRLDRSWVDTAGRDLLVSFRLRARGKPHETVAAVAAALRGAAAALVAEPVGFKWPNDLVVESGSHPGKLAGMLAEYVAGEQPAVIVGCGVNVGSQPQAGASKRDPRGDEGTTTAHKAATTGSSSKMGRTSIVAAGLRERTSAADLCSLRDDLLAATISGILLRLGSPSTALEELRAHSVTLGRAVRVELGENRAVTGTAVQIDPSGRLMVEHPGGRCVVEAGDIVHLHDEDTPHVRSARPEPPARR